MCFYYSNDLDVLPNVCVSPAKIIRNSHEGIILQNNAIASGKCDDNTLYAKTFGIPN